MLHYCIILGLSLSQTGACQYWTLDFIATLKGFRLVRKVLHVRTLHSMLHTTEPRKDNSWYHTMECRSSFVLLHKPCTVWHCIRGNGCGYSRISSTCMLLIYDVSLPRWYWWSAEHDEAVPGSRWWEFPWHGRCQRRWWWWRRRRTVITT
jgi:hypothetical protein